MELSQFKNTASGWHSRWQAELKSSDRFTERYHKRADRVVKRYVDEREDAESNFGAAQNLSRLNLFHSNITTMKSMMYGSMPKVEVNRTFQDPNDDVGRVAGLIMSRILNNDIRENGAEYNFVLRSCLEDRLVPGLGVAKIRYVAEFEPAKEEFLNEETQETEIREVENLSYEDCLVEYHHWRDVRWGWARQWSEVPWVAFRTYLSKEDAEERFGAKVAKRLEYSQQTIEGTKEAGEGDNKEHREKAAVWEIWDKESKKVFWYSDGAKAILDYKDDPLKLRGFFPCPPFLLANATTSFYIPIPDFYMAQDLYNEIDRLQTRIVTITKAVKVVGVYNQAVDGVKRMLQEGTDNDLIPVDSWAMLAESGGLKGVIDWFPIEQVVMALEKLEALRDSHIALLFQVVGLADIMRGQGNPTGGRVSAQEQTLKAQFGSVRIQALQDQFGEFASDLLQLKAEVISKHFEPETIAYMAIVNAMPQEDQRYVPQAIQLIKDWRSASLRVKIRPESVAMVDYGALKQERMEYLNSLGLFLQSAAPLVEMAPGSTPMLLELLKWGLAGFKGGNEIEGVLDRAIDEVKRGGIGGQDGGGGEAAAKAAEAQAKAQADLMKIKASLEADLTKIQAKLQADLQLIQAKVSAESQHEVSQAMAARIEDISNLRNSLAEIQAQSQARIQEIHAHGKIQARQKSSR